MRPEVSIVTVYYNCPEDMLALQNSIRQHLVSGPFEWIVADNRSDENLSEKLSDAIYIRMPENYGFAKANNLAVERSSAPYLFFVNPDCLFMENCLPPLLDAMREAAICGPKVLNEDGSLQLSFGPFLSMPAEFRQQRRMKFEKTERVQKWIETLGQTRVDYVSGCALMISSDVYKRVGGFDETFFLYEEDVDLCKRVHDLGLPTMYVPSAVIVHKRNQTVRTEQERSRKEYRKSQIYYYKKHHGWFQNALLKCYLFIRRKNV